MGPEGGAGPTGPDVRVLQIHPTLRCNLRCLHCYSASGPDRTEELDVGLVRSVLTDARAEGYNAVGVSGGEPLLYGPLTAVLGHAKGLGMATTVTTNGTVGTEAQLASLGGVVDLLAISLDGLGPAHNRMRGAPRAFESLVRRLPAVRATGIPFGFIVTLTLRNAAELGELAEFAADQGASLLQVHPLEETGSARDHLPGQAPDAEELTVAFLEAARIQREYAGRLIVQFDAVDLEAARAEPGRLYADAPVADPSARPLADLVGSIVLEADGVIVPLQYGFGRAYAIADAVTGLRAGAAAWKAATYPEFRALCADAYGALVERGSTARPFINWYGAVSALSASHRALSR
ncbi:radical SAM protein [Kitasatospora sp. NPDC057223]|uniref:radical SAM protein n=1 Tax=Kitasatospora sp. NPDC057223 TaxID=3346055 RepID=UPI00363C78A4